MYAKVRLRLKETGEMMNIEVPLPSDIRLDVDSISDHVSDHLDNMKVPYKWYRVLLNSESKIG